MRSAEEGGWVARAPGRTHSTTHRRRPACRRRAHPPPQPQSSGVGAAPRFARRRPRGSFWEGRLISAASAVPPQELLQKAVAEEDEERASFIQLVCALTDYDTFRRMMQEAKAKKTGAV